LAFFLIIPGLRDSLGKPIWPKLPWVGFPGGKGFPRLKLPLGVGGLPHNNSLTWPTKGLGLRPTFHYWVKGKGQQRQGKGILGNS